MNAQPPSLSRMGGAPKLGAYASREVDMRPISILLLGALSVPGLVHAANCPPSSSVQPLRPTVLAPVASELAMIGSMLGTPIGVLSHNVDAAEAVDQVLLRIQID